MKQDLFDSLIQDIDIDLIPMEFIVMAKVIFFDNTDKFMEGSELEKYLRGSERKKLAGLNVVFDVKKIRTTITSKSNAIFDDVDAQFEIMWAKNEKNTDF